jgi:hypothetical protein
MHICLQRRHRGNEIRKPRLILPHKMQRKAQRTTLAHSRERRQLIDSLLQFI